MICNSCGMADAHCYGQSQRCECWCTRRFESLKAYDALQRPGWESPPLAPPARELTRAHIIAALKRTAYGRRHGGTRLRWDESCCYVCQQHGEYVELAERAYAIARAGGISDICGSCYERLLPLPAGWELIE